MSSAKSIPAPGTGRRRLYVFVAVGLALFLLGIVAAGFVFHGFTQLPAESLTAAPSQETLQADAHKAEKEYRAARKASAAALVEYETAQRRFLDFLGTHFGELAADIPSANSLSDSIAKQAEQIAEEAAKPVESEPTLTAPEPPPLTMVANPEWTVLRGQLEALQQKRKNLLDTLTPQHPAVTTIDYDIADVESKLQAVPAQIPGKLDSPAQNNAVVKTPVAPAEKPTPKQQVKVVPPLPAVDLASWASRWRTDDGKFRELADRLSAAQLKYQQAQQHEVAAQEWQIEAVAALAEAAPVEIPQTAAASPRQTIAWSGLLAALIALCVAWQARITEPVYRAAAAVRQSLDLPVLGLLSRPASQTPRERPSREPLWVRRSVLVAELWLAAVVILLAATAVSDQQFLRDLIADPLSACSKKFWC